MTNSLSLHRDLPDILFRTDKQVLHFVVSAYSFQWILGSIVFTVRSSSGQFAVINKHNVYNYM